MNRLAVKVVREVVGIVDLLQCLANNLVLERHIERTACHATIYDNRIVEAAIFQ